MSLSIHRSLGERWTALQQQQFPRLLMHCIDRIFYGGEGTDSGDVNFGIAALLALLAAPGAFISFVLASKYGSLFLWFRGFSSGSNRGLQFDPYVESLPDEYFFVVLSMVVAAAVAIWKWNNLLPDRRDFANLAHLPISHLRLFLANALALALLVGVVSFDVNAGSAIIFPVLACASRPGFSYTSRFFSTHLTAVVLSAGFGFFSVLTLLGLLMAMLSFSMFKRISVYIRSALLICCAALLTTVFSEPRQIQHLELINSQWFFLPPPAWFVGLCQSLRGIHNALFFSLRSAAVVTSILAPLLAVGAYVMSFRKIYLRSAETMSKVPAGGGLLIRPVLRTFDRFLLPDSTQRAGFRFAWKALFRSEVQSLTWIGFMALGVIVAVQGVLPPLSKGVNFRVIPPSELLAAPYVLSYFLILGLRTAFEIPVVLHANWLFRFATDPLFHNCDGLARRLILTFEVPLFATCFGLYARFWSWKIALFHTLAVLTISVLLIETALLHFRKIPFTCSMPTFESSSPVTIFLCALGVIVVGEVIPTLEYQAFINPFPMLILFIFLLLSWAGYLYIRRWDTTDEEHRIIFDDTPSVAVETIDLTFRR